MFLGPPERLLNARKIDKIGLKPKRLPPQYKLASLKNQSQDDAIDVAFDKCMLSLKQNSIEADEIHVESDENGQYICILLSMLYFLANHSIL